MRAAKKHIISHVIYWFLFFIHQMNCCKDCILLSGCKNKVLCFDKDMDFFQLPFSLVREESFWEYFSFNICKLPSQNSNIVPTCEKQSENCSLWLLQLLAANASSEVVRQLETPSVIAVLFNYWPSLELQKTKRPPWLKR